MKIFTYTYKLVYKKAFTLIELIFVVLILGIVASIGSSIIANLYKNYLLQRATYRASFKTELAAQQIANYLSYRIYGTTIARNPNALTDNVYVTDPTLATDNNHTTLEWIGSDNDGFSAAILPPWNGYCDINNSSSTTVKTPGSNLTLADTIIQKLSQNGVSLSGTAAGDEHPAIFFRNIHYTYDDSTSPPTVWDYDPLTCMGLTPSSDTSCVSTVGMTVGNTETLNFLDSPARANKLIAEHYKLAWTAYSIRQIPNANGLFDLKLCYNYQPWEGEQLNANGCPGNENTIITNVSVFKFAESGYTFRFKLCAQENIGEDYNISICKEKAVVL